MPDYFLGRVFPQNYCAPHVGACALGVLAPDPSIFAPRTGGPRPRSNIFGLFSQAREYPAPCARLTNMNRDDFKKLAGADATELEARILSAGREFLPACAIAVLDGTPAPDAGPYWDFLCENAEWLVTSAQYESACAQGYVRDFAIGPR